MNPTISAVIGRNARRIRTEQGLTLDGVAREARRWGAAWNTGTLSRIERGGSAATVETLLLLSLVLTVMSDEPVTPAKLVQTDSDVELSTGQALDGKVIGVVFAGSLRPDGLMGEDAERSLVPDDAVRDTIDQAAQDLFDLIGPDVTFEQFTEARKHYSLADERAASKVGLNDVEFIAYSLKLWGRVMSEEAEARTEPGTNPQKRGRVTRVLMDELRRSIRGDD